MLKRQTVLSLMGLVAACSGEQGPSSSTAPASPVAGMAGTGPLGGGAASLPGQAGSSSGAASTAPAVGGAAGGGVVTPGGAGGMSTTPTTQGGFKLTVSSALALARQDEMVELAWGTILASMPAATPETLVVKVVGGAELPSQALDDDGDDLWDTLIFPVTLAAAESLTIEVSAGSPAKPAPRVVGQPRQTAIENDYYWESDRVGYRVKAHGPANNVDIFLKSTSELVIYDWYTYDFHEDRGQGLDPYHIGERPGAGGSGLLINGQWRHPAAYTGVKTIASGPLRTELELTYADYGGGGVTVKELKRIRLDAGSWLSRHQSTYTLSGAASATAVGAVSLPLAHAEVAIEPGWASVWGDADVPSAGSFGLALVEVPGTNAVLEQVPSSTVGSSGGSGEVFLRAEVASATPFAYYAGVGWSKGGFPDKASWDAHVQQFQQRLASPLTVTVQ